MLTCDDLARVAQVFAIRDKEQTQEHLTVRLA